MGPPAGPREAPGGLQNGTPARCSPKLSACSWAPEPGTAHTRAPRPRGTLACLKRGGGNSPESSLDPAHLGPSTPGQKPGCTWRCPTAMMPGNGHTASSPARLGACPPQMPLIASSRPTAGTPGPPAQLPAHSPERPSGPASNTPPAPGHVLTNKVSRGRQGGLLPTPQPRADCRLACFSPTPQTPAHCNLCPGPSCKVWGVGSGSSPPPGATPP